MARRPSTPRGPASVAEEHRRAGEEFVARAEDARAGIAELFASGDCEAAGLLAARLQALVGVGSRELRYAKLPRHHVLHGKLVDLSYAANQGLLHAFQCVRAGGR